VETAITISKNCWYVSTIDWSFPFYSKIRFKYTNHNVIQLYLI